MKKTLAGILFTLGSVLPAQECEPLVFQRSWMGEAPEQVLLTKSKFGDAYLGVNSSGKGKAEISISYDWDKDGEIDQTDRDVYRTGSRIETRFRGDLPMRLNHARQEMTEICVMPGTVYETEDEALENVEYHMEEFRHIMKFGDKAKTGTTPQPGDYARLDNRRKHDYIAVSENGTKYLFMPSHNEFRIITPEVCTSLYRPKRKWRLGAYNWDPKEQKPIGLNIKAGKLSRLIRETLKEIR